MRITFLGAAGTVTGSKTLIETGDTRILVDCGLFQGFKALRQRNWAPLPVEPSSLDAVVLTHAHIDHSGYLPRLTRQGFKGPVYATEATCDLLGLLLPDAGHLQEEDARYANKHGFSRHDPAQPLYTEEQARAALRQLKPVSWSTVITIGSLRISWRPAGHILGAALVRVEGPGGSILFSGDLGRPHDPILPAPADVPDVPDVLVLESTYGDRLHDASDPQDALADVVCRTIQRRGMLLIPSFAVGRAQAVLYGLHRLKETGRIPKDLPIFLNSPMAVDTTELYLRHVEDHRLSPAETSRMCRAATLVRTVQESKRLNQRRGPGVIISASGMLTGGRVLHHLKAFAGDSRNTLLFVGYQAGGTRGASILQGAESVRIHGEAQPIRCEVARIDAWSAHADHREITDWLARWPSAPRQVVLNHGEPAATDAMRQHLQDRLGWSATVAELGTELEVIDHGERAEVLLQAPSTGKRARRRRADVEPLPEPEPVDDTAVDAALASIRAERGVVVVGHRDARWGKAMLEVPALMARLLPGAALVAPSGPMASGLEHAAHEADVPLVAIAAPTLREPHLPARTQALIAFPGGFSTLSLVTAALDRMVRGLGPRVPVVLVDYAFWDDVLGAELLRERGYAPEQSADLIVYADTVEQAVEAVARSNRR